MAIIHYLDIVLGAQTRTLDRGLDAGKKSVGGFAAAVSSGAGGALAALGPMAIAAGAAIGTALAGVASVSAVFSGIRSELDTIDEMSKAADRANVSFRELAQFRFVAGEGAGLAAEAADAALVKMQLSLSQAKDKGGELAEQLRAIGLDAGQLLRAGPVEAFKQLSQATRQMNSGAEQMQLAFRLFGREGKDLVTTLRGGPEAIEESMAAAEQLGLTLSDAQAIQVEAANDAWGRVYAIVQGVFRQLAAAAAPVLQVIATELSSWVASFGKANELIPQITDYLAWAAGTAVDLAKGMWNFYEALYQIQTLDFAGAKQSLKEMVDASQGTNAKSFVKKVQAARQAAEAAAKQQTTGLIDVDAIEAAEQAKAEAAKEAARAAARAKEQEAEAAKEAARAAARAKEQEAVQAKRRELDRLRKMEDQADSAKNRNRVNEQTTFGALEKGSVAAYSAALNNNQQVNAAQLQEKANTWLSQIHSTMAKVEAHFKRLETVGVAG